MNVAEKARAAAVHMEVKKDGLSQLQDGSWVFKFKVHPDQIPASLLTAPMGTRFVAALVEVGDDEQPVEREQITPPSSRVWADLTPAHQAGIRCNEPAFWRFLGTRYAVAPGSVKDAEVAADVIRNVLGVTSRKDITPGSAAADQWRKIDADYQFWMQNP